ncbi:MAG TPA: transposase [Sphingomonas sp.]|uniref:transposase n=1 Tax=Sphingomonas sp. TaxID=28214 RepID=UPI002D1A0FB3|nr:transposase [Sphingomonas sp.]HMI20713.1 transposase [Sphingomonas sp.]
MARLARAVFPGHPHHVTQRGNGRAQTFFEDADYALYRDLLGEHCAAAGVEVWAWVLMPNHVHLVLAPSDVDGIRRALAVVHRKYAGHIHAKLKRTGHFWQGRFGCVAMDEAHLATALRYVALNPVRARLADRAVDWPWSSVHAQLGQDDGITITEPVRARHPDFAALLAAGEEEAAIARLRKAESIGRPIGDEAFLDRLETETGRTLKRGKPGRRPDISALSP